MGEDRSWKALGEFIRTQRRLADMSLRQVAQVAKVSNPYLSQIERGIYKPSADILKGIAEALQISAETLFARAGFLAEKDGDASASTVTVEQAIRADIALTADQKKALIGVYRGFAGSKPR